jgi:hypothetical protein
VNALASLLRQFWFAINRVPHQTGWGIFGFKCEFEMSLADWTREKFSVFVEAAQRIIPTVIVIILNIFR